MYFLPLGGARVEVRVFLSPAGSQGFLNEDGMRMDFSKFRGGTILTCSLALPRRGNL